MFERQVSTGPLFGPDETLGAVTDIVAALQRRNQTCEAIGVGFPGLVDSDRGIAHSSVILQSWQRVELRSLVSESVGIPSFLDNDVNNAARAELAARNGCRDMLMVMVGTGIGGAVVLGGRVWTGAGGFAGEIGHVSIDSRGPRCPCGRRGCVGVLASGSSIERRLGLGNGELAAAVHADDPDLREQAEHALSEASSALGKAIANALNLLNVRLVVIGGGVTLAGRNFVDAVEEAAKREAFPETASCRFEVARSGYRAGAVGAALLARHDGDAVAVW